METSCSLHLRVVRAAAVLQFLGERAIVDLGFTMDQFELLEAIARYRKPKTISRHARELGVMRRTLSRHARALEVSGLVERIRGRRNRTEIGLTDSGRNALALLRERWGTVETRVREHFGDEALAKITTELIRFTDPGLGAAERVAPLPGEFANEALSELVALMKAERDA